MNNTSRNQHDSIRNHSYYTILYYPFIYRVSKAPRCTDVRRAVSKRISYMNICADLTDR